MKKEELIALGIDEEVAKQILVINGKDIEKHKSQITKLTQDLESANEQADAYKQQLDDANTQIQSFKEMDIEGIRQSADDWKAKYDNDIKALQDKMNAKEYEFAIKEYANQFNFTSERVKNSIIEDLKAKEFKLNDGVLLGADDYMKQLRENEPTSFVSEEPNDPLPTFTKPTGGGNPADGPKFGFANMFTGVRPRESK